MNTIDKALLMTMYLNEKNFFTTVSLALENNDYSLNCRSKAILHAPNLLQTVIYGAEIKIDFNFATSSSKVMTTNPKVPNSLYCIRLYKYKNMYYYISY